MKLPKEQLIRKFPFLKKFENQKWVENVSITQEMDASEIPIHAAKILVSDMVDFCEKTKFCNNWESNFSVKIRLQQILDLLIYFTESDDFFKTIKGTNLRHK